LESVSTGVWPGRDWKVFLRGYGPVEIGKRSLECGPVEIGKRSFGDAARSRLESALWNVARSRLESVPSGMRPGRDWKTFYWDVARSRLENILFGMWPGQDWKMFLRGYGPIEIGKHSTGMRPGYRLLSIVGSSRLDWNLISSEVGQRSSQLLTGVLPTG
jgi:hypothetical protein